MKQQYYIKATKDGMKANFNNYQHKMGITKHPNPDKTGKLCSDDFHLAKSVKDAISYLNDATEFYLCKPVGKIYAEDDTKIRAGGINILWKIPMNKFPAWDKAHVAWDKACVAWDNARAAITMEDIIKLYEEQLNEHI